MRQVKEFANDAQTEERELWQCDPHVLRQRKFTSDGRNVLDVPISADGSRRALNCETAMGGGHERIGTRQRQSSFLDNP